MMPINFSLSLQCATDPSVLPFICLHHQQSYGGRRVSGVAKNKYVYGAVKSALMVSRLGYQLLLTTSNSPTIGVVCLLDLFLVFNFEVVYISKEMFL